MNCARCNAENPISGKFCRSCGAILGIVCTQCGTVAHPDDRYCISCGLDLAGQPVGGSVESSRKQLPAPSQYSQQEIEDLLALRKATRRETKAAMTLNQDDVDKLF